MFGQTITLLDESDHVINDQMISFNDIEQFNIMKLSEELQLNEILKFREYYEDYTYEVNTLESLLNELS